MTSTSIPWTPERLAYWYFRLNGFLTTENFVIHDDTTANQRTDADILAVRFAHRAENLLTPMRDDSKIVSCETFVNVVIAEVKTGLCNLNGPWTNPNTRNMYRALKAIGCVPDVMMDLTTDSLYQRGISVDSRVTIRLVPMGEWKNNELPVAKKQQITWNDVIAFIRRRFNDYERQKSSVSQWTDDGRLLKELALSDEAEHKIRRAFGLGPPQHVDSAARNHRQ